MADYTCISIIDESSPNSSVHFQDFATFRNNYPTRVFWLLQPTIQADGSIRFPISDLNVPQNYIAEYTNGSGSYTGLTHPVVQVNRDEGDVARRSDWFAICQLNTLPPGSVISVAIDTSGSMTLATVQASYDYFIQRCNTAGIDIVWDLRYPDERWIPPHNKGLPPVAIFNSDKADITVGESATLSWTVTGDTTGVTLSDGTTTQNVGLTDSLVVSPTVTTTYTLVAAGFPQDSVRTIKLTVFAQDTDPDLFSFSNIPIASPSTTYTTETVTITGLGAGVSVNVTATNNAETSVNGGAFSTATKTITNNQTLRVRMVSSANPDTPKTTSVNVGTASTTWTITTKSAASQVPNSYSFNEVDDAPLQAYTNSNIETITGLSASTTVTALSNGFESSVNGGAWSSSSKTISNGQTLQLRVLTSNILGETKTETVSVGAGAPVEWKVTNVRVADSSPDYFDIDDVDDAPLSTEISSTPITITGINVPTTVTTTNNALISIDGGTFVSSPTTINRDQTISVRLTSSSTPGGFVSTEVTIGGLTDTWKVTSTTAGDSVPDDLFFFNKDNQPPSTLIESNTVIISGMTSSAIASVSNGAELSVGGGSWTNDVSVETGDTIKLRITSNATLGGYVSTTLKIGSGYTTSWRVDTYSSADNLDPGVWYSRRGKKEDGLAIGTVISISRDRSGNWGTLDGSLSSRYPGWIECDGRSVNAIDYPDLFNSIGNTYGGTATKTLNGNTYNYSGSFNLPNYRNRKLFGIGRVDGNSAASPIVTTYFAPDVNSPSTGDGNIVGSRGGNWYIKKYDALGTPPDEQVYDGTDSLDGKFYRLGTITTNGGDLITGETTFAVTGDVTATIGPLSNVIVTVPQHEHDLITAQADPIEVGRVAWGTVAFYQINTGEIGATTYSSIGYNSVVSPGGEVNKSFNNYWAGDVQNNIPGLPPGGTQVGRFSAAVDVNNVTGNVGVYSPGELKTHSHYLSRNSFGSPANVYGWGNNDGGGTAASGMSTDNTVDINFSQTELAMSANEATFELNPSKKVLPTPSLVPENTIPLLTKYYRVKYIIKAY